MSRLWALLLALILVAPIVSAWTLPVQDECQEESECEEGGICDFDCSLCICCAHRTPGVTTSFATSPPEDLPASPTVAAQAAPLAPPPIDILHVPKSA